MSTCLGVAVPNGRGQQIIAPSPEPVDERLTLAEQVDPDRTRWLLPSQLAAQGPAGKRGLVELGPVAVRPHAQYRLLYATGLLPQAEDQSGTTVHELELGLLLELGRSWSLDYTPALRYYSNDRFQDTLSHSVSFRGTRPFGAWELGLSQSYALFSNPLLETGQQSRQESYATLIHGKYQHSLNSSFELSASQQFQSTEGFIDSRSWSLTGWGNYQISRLQPGVGVVVGYDQVTPGNDMTFAQAQVRLQWNPSERFFAQGTAGVEVRHFLRTDIAPRINPVFSAVAAYQPFEHTQLSLSASRAVQASLFGEFIIEQTQVTAGIRQRFLKRFFADLNGGYQRSDFQPSGDVAAGQRSDRYVFFLVRLSSTWRERGTVGVFYQFSDNATDRAGFALRSTQIGFDISYKF